MTRKLALAVAAALLVPSAALFAQAAATPSPLDFSGVVFGSYQWRTDDASKATTGGQPADKFDIGRVYLNFRMPAGDRGSIRVTTDIFQQTGAAAAYYAGWTIRLKYGYFQYNLSPNFAGAQGLGALARIGMLHTVVVDHVENFWPRWLGPTADEQHGFFSSADVGVASLLTLPKRRGEAYVTITNGTQYSSGETDRFKDFAARFTFTPFSSNTSSILQTLAISPWYYVGATGSAFAAPPNSISAGLQRDRRGLFVGVRDRRLTAGAEFSQRVEETETAPPGRVVTGRTGNLGSVFTLFRPFELYHSKKRSNFGVIARWDNFKLNKSQPASATNPDNTFFVGGLFWDLNTRATLALDYQELKSEVATTTFPSKTLFLHWVANF